MFKFTKSNINSYRNNKELLHFLIICPSICIRLSRYLQDVIHSIWSNICNKLVDRFYCLTFVGGPDRELQTWQTWTQWSNPDNPRRHSRSNLSLNILLSFVMVSSFWRLRFWMELKLLSRWFLPIKTVKTTKFTRSVSQWYAYLSI